MGCFKSRGLFFDKADDGIFLVEGVFKRGI